MKMHWAIRIPLIVAAILAILPAVAILIMGEAIYVCFYPLVDWLYKRINSLTGIED